MVMSGRVPRAAMRFAGAALAVASAAIGVRSPKHGAPRQLLRRLRDLARVDERGALAHTFMYKLDGTDDSRGTARFTGAGAVIDWDDYTDDPVNRFAAERLEQWAERVGGTIIPNVARLPGMRSFGVHPLGGARMATGVEGGVVDPNGRVFDPRGGLHDGLRIADASIFAGSIGVPPSLTVAALAERIADDMIGASS
jgi:choline dehydrogenase-like flavoprotein